MSLSNDVINNAWHNSYVVTQSRAGAVQPQVKSMVLEKILVSSRGKFGTLGEVKTRINSQNPQKNNYTVTLVKFKRKKYGSDGQFTNACEPTTSATNLSRAYTLRRFVDAKITLNENNFACMIQDNASIADFQIQSFFAELHSKLSVAVENQVYSNEYIGKLPALTAGGAMRNFASLPVLKADGNTLNPRAELDLMQDVQYAGIGQYFMVGGTRLGAYQIAQKIASPALSGYDPSKLDMLPSARALMSPMVGASAYIQGLGLTNPALLIEDGALLFVSAPIHPLGTIQTIGNQRVWSVEHPTLPGVFVNIVETPSQICDVNGRPVMTWAGSIVFDVIGEMTCDADGNIWSDGEAFKGVYLYDLACSDDVMCDAPNRTALMADFSKPYDKDCNIDTVCAADSTCRLSVSQGYYEDPDTGRLLLVLNANFTPSAGASVPPAFEWEINSTSLGQSTAIVTIDTTLLNNGDVITVSAIDSLNCEATFTIVLANLQQGCDTLLGAVDSVHVLSGDTIDLGSIAKGLARTVVVRFSTGNLDIVVLSATATGATIGSSASTTLPSTVSVGTAGVVFSINLDVSTSGPQSVAVLATHEGCDGEFELTLNFTVLPG